jgi:hypothetical protein
MALGALAELPALDQALLVLLYLVVTAGVPMLVQLIILLAAWVEHLHLVATALVVAEITPDCQTHLLRRVKQIQAVGAAGRHSKVVLRRVVAVRVGMLMQSLLLCLLLILMLLGLLELLEQPVQEQGLE